MKKFVLIYLVSFVVLGLWVFYKVVDGISNLEECAAEEMLMHGERDFLIELIKLTGMGMKRDQVYESIKKKYMLKNLDKQVVVRKIENGIVWGRLLIEIDGDGRVGAIRELE